MRKFFMTFLVSAGLTLASCPAWAQSEDDKAIADALFDAARDLMSQGKFDEACPKFRDSHEIDPAVGTLLNLALCYRDSGKTASAWSTFREAAALARQLGQTDREELARKETQTLEAKLTKLVIEVTPEAQAIDGLTVSRDGQPVKETVWGVPWPVDPGDVVVEAVAPGYQLRRASIVAEGEGKVITFKVPALTPEPQTAPDEADPSVAEEEPETKAATPPPAQEQKSSPKAEAAPRGGPGPLPWVLGGLGVAVAGAGTAFGFLSQAAYNDSTQICPDYPSGPCGTNDIQRQRKLSKNNRTYSTLAVAGWGAGGAMVAGAVVWLIVGSGGSSEESALQLQPVFGAESWGLFAQGRF